MKAHRQSKKQPKPRHEEGKQPIFRKEKEELFFPAGAKEAGEGDRVQPKPQHFFSNGPSIQLQREEDVREPEQEEEKRASSEEGRDLQVRAAIRQTLEDYQFIAVQLPNNQQITVRAQYWIYSRKQSVKQHGRAVRAVSDFLPAGVPPRTTSRHIKAGKASPEELRIFIQSAVNRAFHLRQQQQDIPRSLPQLGEVPGEWQDQINSWMAESQIGIDCSSFVFNALLRAKTAVGGETAGEQWTDTFRSERGRFEPPGSGNLKSRSRGAQGVDSPSDLRTGDLMYLSRTPDAPAHIRIIESVTQQEDGSIEIVTAESASSKGGPAEQQWTFQNPRRFTSIKKPTGNTDEPFESAGRRNRRARYYRHQITASAENPG